MKARIPKGMGGGPQNMNAMIKLGGDLQIRLADDGHLFMTGPAVEVFSGEIDL